MTEQQTTVLSKITSYLSLTEKIFLTGLVIGLIIAYFNADNRLIIQVSLLGLAITYLLTAFRIIEIPRQEDEEFEFKDLLAWTIVPKVIWMTCGVSLLGLFLYSLRLGHNGHLQAFRVGGLGIAIGIIILAYAFLTGTKHMKSIMPTVIRAIPLLIVDFYLLFN